MNEVVVGFPARAAARPPEDARVRQHPCYSEDAHHYYARMHIPVAPVCNIQCNYCNRKYDCANESRPGVVSGLLSPEAAVAKVAAVAERLHQLTVVGIAGPGDALAVPDFTWHTLKLLYAQVPDVTACLSTNGLNLPENVARLNEIGVGHITVTMNTLDPVVGAEIYRWIFWRNKRLKGIEAARVLLEQQQIGVQRMVEAGALVKINTVLIPGVNDADVVNVNRFAQDAGAFVHNIVPLIARPEHGTYFGVSEQAEPTAEELDAVRESCGDGMRLMRHCRQCRADAVGMLGQDQSASLCSIGTTDRPYGEIQAEREQSQALIEENRRQRSRSFVLGSSLAKMRKVAVASKGMGLINQHFGHAREFLIYGVDATGHKLLSIARADAYCTGAEECDERDGVMERVLKALEGCEAMLCARIGATPKHALTAAGIEVNTDYAMDGIDEALSAWREIHLSTPACGGCEVS